MNTQAGTAPAAGSVRSALRPTDVLRISRGGCASGRHTSKDEREVRRAEKGLFMRGRRWWLPTERVPKNWALV